MTSFFRSFPRVRSGRVSVSRASGSTHARPRTAEIILLRLRGRGSVKQGREFFREDLDGDPVTQERYPAGGAIGACHVAGNRPASLCVARREPIVPFGAKPRPTQLSDRSIAHKPGKCDGLTPLTVSTELAAPGERNCVAKVLGSFFSPVTARVFAFYLRTFRSRERATRPERVARVASMNRDLPFDSVEPIAFLQCGTHCD